MPKKLTEEVRNRYLRKCVQDVINQWAVDWQMTAADGFPVTTDNNLVRKISGSLSGRIVDLIKSLG
jgi:hypothetical protein